MSWDLIVVGGGSAGAAAAFQGARAGLKTLLLEKHALGTAGASWVNAVYRGAFDEAGVERPTAPELRAAAHRFHLVAGWGPYKMVIDDTGLLDIDMRLLVARLRDGARAAGAELREHTWVTDVRPGAVVAGGETIRGRVVVDAAGLGGVFESAKPRAADVCAAAQGVYAVRERAAAVAFFDGFGAALGETVCFASIAGGYSIVATRLEEGGDAVSILTGSLPSLGHRSGRALRDEFAAEHAWIGEMRFGGQAPVPLSRPRRRLAVIEGEHAIVRLGDAAGQVYAAHGSGIGAQLVAAKMLAGCIANEGAPGATRYERSWHRRYGPHFLASAAFRRMSMLLSPRSLEVVLKRGLLPTSVIRFGLAAGV